MDNFLIIDDVDTCYIEQNSWLILLEKQINRNYYLIKLHEIDKSHKKSKITPKELFVKVKCSINNHIKHKIKNRKNSEKNMYSNELNSQSISLRRKTEEIPKKQFLKIFIKNDPEFRTSGRYFASHQLEKSNDEHDLKDSSKNYNILPFPGSELGINESTKLLKKKSKILTEKQEKITKLLSHTKPILSLHDLELNSRDVFPSEDLSYQRRLTQMEKLLIRSSMNSPKKEMHGKNQFIVKKIAEELPEIGRLDCKSLGMSVYANKNDKVLYIETEPPLSPGCEKICDSSKKTQETKESDCENFCGLESILEYYAKSKKKPKEEVFEDYHISKTAMLKNYRISKVRNIKFPVL